MGEETGSNPSGGGKDKKKFDPGRTYTMHAVRVPKDRLIGPGWIGVTAIVMGVIFFGAILVAAVIWAAKVFGR